MADRLPSELDKLTEQQLLEEGRRDVRAKAASMHQQVQDRAQRFIEGRPRIV